MRPRLFVTSNQSHSQYYSQNLSMLSTYRTADPKRPLPDVRLPWGSEGKKQAAAAASENVEDEADTSQKRILQANEFCATLKHPDQWADSGRGSSKEKRYPRPCSTS